MKLHTSKYLNSLEKQGFDLQGQIFLREKRFWTLESLFLHIKSKILKESRLRASATITFFFFFFEKPISPFLYQAKLER